MSKTNQEYSTHIKCKAVIKKVYFPKNLEEHIPGKWASMLLKIIDLEEGIPYIRYNEDDLIMVVGKAPSLSFFKEYRFSGKFQRHSTYGVQYEIEYMEVIAPIEDEMQQRAYLEYITTEHQVDLLYENLRNPFEAVKNKDIIALMSVPGIGGKTAIQIIEKYSEKEDKANAMSRMKLLGITEKQADRLLEAYKSAEAAAYVVENTPYQMIKDVKGIGWSKADAIAQNNGFAPDSVARIKAYLIYILQSLAEEGNSWTNVDDVVSRCIDDLELTSPDNIRTAIYELGEEGEIWWNEEKTKFALTRIIQLEKNIAEELYRLQSAKTDNFRLTREQIEVGIAQAEQKMGFEYTEEQRAAINLILKNNVCILTAPAGCGKSASVSAVLSILKGYPFAQTALSGRAASRLGELTGEEGKTIHRLLGVEEGRFVHNKEAPLDEDIIVLDEISMVGAELFYSLIQAIKTGAKLIMIGDDGQLESIGYCNIFKDMLTSEVIPVARLTKIHRQAARSAIITESNKVRRGYELIPRYWIGTETRGELKDLDLDIYDSSIDSQEHIINQFNKVYNALGSAEDIQIVLPQKNRGDICTARINSIVQEIVNPNGENPVVIGDEDDVDRSYTLREGDRVIVNRNNYETKKVNGDKCPVFNGNRGIIKRIDNESKRKIMIVDFEQWGEIVITRGHWRDIELAYALTCHKLQGSEAGYVIIGLDMSAMTLLTKEWLYTAITRAKKRCILCAETNALRYCVSHTNIPYKRTFLRRFLLEEFGEF